MDRVIYISPYTSIIDQKSHAAIARGFGTFRQVAEYIANLPYGRNTR
jgi:hypothetical protein